MIRILFGTGPRILLAKREVLAPFYISLNSGEHLTCSIIDSCHQAQTRPSLLQPGMRTAINLY